MAQTDSIYVWNKWCAKKDTLLLFYEGNNTIQVYSKGLNPKDIKLKSLDKTLRIGLPEIKGDTLSVLAMPYHGKDKQMRLAILNAKTQKPLKTLYFTADSLPAPVAQLGSIQQRESFRKTVLSQTKLRVIFPNSLYSYPYTVRQYTFTSATSRGRVNMPVANFLLPNAVLRAIGETADGDTITFTSIVATCPECASRTLADLRIRLRPPLKDTVNAASISPK